MADGNPGVPAAALREEADVWRIDAQNDGVWREALVKEMREGEQSYTLERPH